MSGTVEPSLRKVPRTSAHDLISPLTRSIRLVARLCHGGPESAYLINGFGSADHTECPTVPMDSSARIAVDPSRRVPVTLPRQAPLARTHEFPNNLAVAD